ncbi:anaphase-promoting complex subunit 10 [Phalaenopsis equestris]|uniref:anaphase-promoting complex subunit 10 n=1 Tax=Phalaenopsis equestris TaxID=78828 RepID=UPI0009E579AF|nr:anaphase-promoting complex subunit 10 [Phalaenopsis equestris]
MATESDGEEETAGKLTGSPNLVVDDDSREMSVSSGKPGNGVLSLRDDNLETYWQLAYTSFAASFSDTFIHTFMLQLAVLSNHLNGRDTHIRQIKIYGPRPNPIPTLPFHFTSKEFISYSTIR